MVVWILMIVMEYFEESWMEQSQFPYDIALFRLSFCSCNYGIFFASYPYSPWASCVHVSVEVPAPVVETYQRLDYVD